MWPASERRARAGSPRRRRCVEPWPAMHAPDPLARALSGEENKERWNTWWILGWYVTTSAWVVIGLSDPGYGWGVLTFAVLFLPQELSPCAGKVISSPPSPTSSGPASRAGSPSR